MSKKKRLWYNKIMKEYLIDVFWDEEAKAWGAVNNEIPLALESDSLDMLIDRVGNVTPEILESNGKDTTGYTLRFRAERIMAASS